ncbi:RING-H2 finger protein ATL2 [Cucurbita moschata]|uniref:RING-type E3 ubiquitin transferase n=2 Tax=Cucurbita TaxID=3660 RepID=A0A6J1GYS2_CUCMO|nr:RING-H2 finger protein ATL2 [Cucurbita moschata]
MEAAMDDPSSTSPPGSNDFALSGKIMLSAIIILLFVVVLIICLHLYARWYVLRARRRGTLRRRNRLVFYFEPENPSAARAAASASHLRGLDPSVLNSLPVFTFSSKSFSDPIDCAVCLSEFEENEKGRTLPKCRHSFHTDCIDMWFHSHTTCPLCRTPVERPPETPVEVAVSIGEPAITEPGPSSSDLCVECDISDRMASSSTGSRSFRARRKPGELAGVSIEIPTRRDGEFAASLSPTTPSFKSPISRVMSLSFKMIIGRERRGGVSPSGTSVGCSSGAGGELDIEKGKENAV